VRIAFQGEPGAYSEAAALRFAAKADVLPCRSFEDVFSAVTEGRATHGILPMENSIGGSIHRNYDLLVEHELPIVGEVELRVDHCLLALPGTPMNAVRVVYSHPQALAQCEDFLQQLAGVEIVAVYDTAGAAKMVRESGRDDAAAVASRRASEVFNLEVLRESIQDFEGTSHGSLSSRVAEGMCPTRTRPRSCSRCRASPGRCSRRSPASRCATST
jgi:prephenate dehydratase